VFYFARFTQQGREGEGDAGIYERAVKGDGERLVYRLPPGAAINSLQFSPDRKWLGFRQSTNDGTAGTERILIVHVGTGETRTVIVAVADNTDLVPVQFLSWTPAGDLLVQKLSGKRSGNGGTSSETVLLPMNGGSPRSFAIPNIARDASGESSPYLVAKWSPDGRMMVLGRDGRGGETFVIENPLAVIRTTTASR
jgi:hypothetical protein